MVKVVLNLIYIYLRKFFAKGDILTISVLIALFSFVVYTIYQQYENFYLLPFVFLLSTASHHLTRNDFSLLKIRKDFRKIIFIEYFLYNVLFLSIFLFKEDWGYALIYLMSLVLIVFLPQKTTNIRYPFDLFDPFWHISFRKYKVGLIMLLAIALIVVAKFYDNPNLALFALFVISFLCSLPYFEREFSAHIAVSHYLGQKYLLHQIKVGVANFLMIFTPVLAIYVACFQFENFWFLPSLIVFPLLGILTKYTFFEDRIIQNISFVFILLGGFSYGIPFLIIPFLYYQSIQKIKKIQYANHQH